MGKKRLIRRIDSPRQASQEKQLIQVMHSVHALQRAHIGIIIHFEKAADACLESEFHRIACQILRAVVQARREQSFSLVESDKS